MKRGCSQCGECLNVCPIFTLFQREEYSPKGKRLLLEPLDGWNGSETPLPWKSIRTLARLCAGCDRCRRQCARSLSTCDLLAEVRASHPHWTQQLWALWIRRAGPIWPLAGRIAALAPAALTPETLAPSMTMARGLLPQPSEAPWLTLTPATRVAETPVVLFAGCTARFVRPEWIRKAEILLRAWGYTVLDGTPFTCCGGTLHHAGMFKAQAETRQANLAHWRALGRPLVATFCASCKHSLDAYAAEGSLDESEATLWKEKVRGLSSLLIHPISARTDAAPARLGYHQPCHWGATDPDLPLLRTALPDMDKGSALCCGMGGILQMNAPQVSAALGRKCLEGFADAEAILTGCSGCALQLAALAPQDLRVRHWLDITELTSSPA